MTYLFVAAVVAVLGASPLLLGGKFVRFIMFGVALFLFKCISFYVALPASSVPFYGQLPEIALFALIAWGVSGRYDGDNLLPWFGRVLVPLAFTGVAVGVWFFQESIFWNDYKYARLLGHVEQKTWTTDIQPLDTDRMMLVPREAALFNARKRVGELGALGSQFVLEKENFALQKIHGRLQHVAPLDFAGFFKWLNTSGVPAYMVVDAHDPNAQTKIVRKSDEKDYFRYTPGAWWTGNLDRHLRLSGITHEKFLDRHMELDDNEKPWWVVTLGVPTIWSSGDVVVGVVIVDPTSGEFKKHRLDDVPAWVDRVFPAAMVSDYLHWNGAYMLGWRNAFFVGKDMYEPEQVVLQFTQDGRATYVTGTTSISEKDDSLISLVYTDTRTGKHTRYEMKGGATVSAIQQLINGHPDPYLARAHSGTVHYINVFGTETAMSPLLVDEVGAYYAVAFIPIMNPDAKKVIHAPDVKEAYKKYIASLSDEGVKIDVSVVEKVVVARGKVERVTAPYDNSIGLMVKGVKPIIYGSVVEFPALRFTQEGDEVEVSYVETNADTTALKKFHNFSLPQRGGMIPQLN